MHNGPVQICILTVGRNAYMDISIILTGMYLMHEYALHERCMVVGLECILVIVECVSCIVECSMRQDALVQYV